MSMGTGAPIKVDGGYMLTKIKPKPLECFFFVFFLIKHKILGTRCPIVSQFSLVLKPCPIYQANWIGWFRGKGQ